MPNEKISKLSFSYKNVYNITPRMDMFSSSNNIFRYFSKKKKIVFEINFTHQYYITPLLVIHTRSNDILYYDIENIQNINSHKTL